MATREFVEQAKRDLNASLEGFSKVANQLIRDDVDHRAILTALLAMVKAMEPPLRTKHGEREMRALHKLAEDIAGDHMAAAAAIIDRGLNPRSPEGAALARSIVAERQGRAPTTKRIGFSAERKNDDDYEAPDYKNVIPFPGTKLPN